MTNEVPKKRKITYTAKAKPFADSSATIHDAAARFQFAGRERSVGLVLKRFDSHEDARLALENYRRLREMGITLLPARYRLRHEDPLQPPASEIIMTDFRKGGNVAMSSNYGAIEVDRGSLISVDTKKLMEELGRLKKAILRASAHGATIPTHAYFAVAPKAGGTDVGVKFVIADVDLVTFEPSAAPDGTCLTNMLMAREFLEICVLSHIQDPVNKNAVEKMIQEWSDSIKKESRKL